MSIDVTSISVEDDDLNVTSIFLEDGDININITEEVTSILEVGTQGPMGPRGPRGVDGVSIQGPMGPMGPVGGNIMIPFSYGDATPKKIYTANNELILRCSIWLITNFDGLNVHLSVGDDVDNNRLLPSSGVYPNEVGEYASSPAYKYTLETDLNLYITLGSGNSTGNGYIVLQV